MVFTNDCSFRFLLSLLLVSFDSFFSFSVNSFDFTGSFLFQSFHNFRLLEDGTLSFFFRLFHD